jgi:hypothetical protein
MLELPHKKTSDSLNLPLARYPPTKSFVLRILGLDSTMTKQVPEFYQLLLNGNPFDNVSEQ